MLPHSTVWIMRSLIDGLQYANFGTSTKNSSFLMNVISFKSCLERTAKNLLNRQVMFTLRCAQRMR